ncbi:MAG TPA: DUF4412 domain-containing protein [Acetobacteraceae bacterium]|jgi:hypothetical protein|nr:DUF4412 domain-containing protein [Acetobacteraceae bacterium]
MPRLSASLGLAALLAAAATPLSPAGADAAPALLPTHDAALSYRVTDARDGRTMLLRAYVKGGAGLVRLDLDGAPGYAILDRPAARVTVVMPAAHGYLEMAIGTAADRFLAQAQGMRFRRIGQARVAGLPCTDWSVRDPTGSGAGDACITADGLVLRAHGGDQGVNGSLIATSVQEAAQPAALFAVPEGYALLGNLPGRRS